VWWSRNMHGMLPTRVDCLKARMAPRLRSP
jgi:hypothetical protein